MLLSRLEALYPGRWAGKRGPSGVSPTGSVEPVEIVAALFVESFTFRQVDSSTRIDITGAYFSVPVESFPVTLEPHLIVLLRCPVDHAGTGVLQVVFQRDGEEVARNRQPFMVEPGKFGYRLVRGELEFAAPGTIEAHCSIQGGGRAVVVPLTALPRPGSTQTD